MAKSIQETVQVLAFDVFGTVVDWHGSIQRDIAALAPHIDADAFARWNPDVFVHDAPLELGPFADRDAVEEQRALDDGAFLHPDVRKQDRVSQGSPHDDRSRCQHAVDDLRLAA